MSFVANAVAGPSRVRVARSALNVAACARHQSTSSASPSTSSPRPRGGRDNVPQTPEEQAKAAMDMAAKQWKAQARVGDRDPAVFEYNYRTWLEIVGPLFKRAKKGEKAKWLGWGMPFPTNPSFQPPPPISDVIMTQIDQELRSGEKTIGQIATQFSVSKARIEAIAKLKEVEAEFRRQNLPLNTAYQAGMERVLGCALPYTADKTAAPSPQALRAEELARVSHESTEAEIQEEERGALGSFGDLRKQSDSQGLEKESWALVSEAEYVSGTSAAQQAMDRASEHPPRPPTPETPSNYNKPGKHVFRFIDTSKKGQQRRAAKEAHQK